MKEIRHLVQEFLGREGLNELNDLVRIREGWSEIAGEEIGARTRPFKLEKGRLYVGAASHSWVQETHYHVEDIKKRLREGLGIDIKEVIIKRTNLK